MLIGREGAILSGGMKWGWGGRKSHFALLLYFSYLRFSKVLFLRFYLSFPLEHIPVFSFYLTPWGFYILDETATSPDLTGLLLL